MPYKRRKSGKPNVDRVNKQAIEAESQAIKLRSELGQLEPGPLERDAAVVQRFVEGNGNENIQS